MAIKALLVRRVSGRSGITARMSFRSRLEWVRCFMSFPCDNAVHRVAFLKLLSGFHRPKAFNPWSYTGEVPNLTPWLLCSSSAGSQLGDSFLKLIYTRLDG